MKKDKIAVNTEQEFEPEAVELDLPEGVPLLHTFYLYLTNGCNLACSHCWITPTFVNGKPSPGDCLDLDLLKLAVRDGKTLGLHNAKLTGGEPVIHPRFLEIVDYLSSKSIKLNMETNGTLIDAQLANHLKHNTSLWFVSISLDSVKPEIHDHFRGVQGAFQKAVRGVEYLATAGFRPQIVMSLHHGNINEIEDMAELAIKLGAGSVKFNPIMPIGRGKEMTIKGATLDFNERIKLVRFVRGEMQERIPIRLFISTPPALSTTKEMLQGKSAGGECGVRNILGILGDGEMALCGIGRSIKELCFGNLGKDSLRDTWISHPTLLKLRKDLDSEFPEICGECIHARRCLTMCVAMNYTRTGKLINPDFLCAEAERRSVFPITRKRNFGLATPPNAIER